jgi:ubiquitin fusion degradation protein 1
LRYNNKEYYLQVLEARPVNPYNAVSIIETDTQVDFAPPVGYEEPKSAPETQTNNKKVCIEHQTTLTNI